MITRFNIVKESLCFNNRALVLADISDPVVVDLPCESCQPFHILALAGQSVSRDTIIDVNLEERTTWIPALGLNMNLTAQVWLKWWGGNAHPDVPYTKHALIFPQNELLCSDPA